MLYNPRRESSRATPSHLLNIIDRQATCSPNPIPALPRGILYASNRCEERPNELLQNRQNSKFTPFNTMVGCTLLYGQQWFSEISNRGTRQPKTHGEGLENQLRWRKPDLELRHRWSSLYPFWSRTLIEIIR